MVRRLFAKQLRLNPVAGSSPVPFAKPTTVEIGKYYRVNARGWDNIIVRYDGPNKSNHCKTCTCSMPMYIQISGPSIVGWSPDMVILEEVNKPD